MQIKEFEKLCSECHMDEDDFLPLQRCLGFTPITGAAKKTITIADIMNSIENRACVRSLRRQ